MTSAPRDAAPRSPDPDSPQFEELLYECVARLEAEGTEVVDEVCRQHPTLADAIRQRLRLLRDAGLLGEPTAAGSIPERLGEFELLEQLGAGGMGVVYLAEQTSLGRQVALKLIRPEHLYFPGARERFAREVQAIARLQHPGIVPVYAGGEESGVPFYAMELIVGCTLAEALDDLRDRAPESLTGADLGRAVAARAGVEARPLEETRFAAGWAETCLGISAQIADALEHAHERGIVHRDVKPSNIAITPDGRAMLFDFGLTSGADVARVTLSGSQVGTLFYMPPEQLRGARGTDVRSDVYSLGVALYELLSLQLPYSGGDRFATEAEILVGRPDRIRARNRRVSVDAETVCLAAMELEPQRRYATARAFAHELRNVLEHRPIVAHPPSTWTHLRRWAQRKPALSAAIVLTVVLVVGAPSVFLWLQSQHADQLRAERDRATTNARIYRQVSDFLVELFRVADPLNEDGEDLSARELLDRGAGRLERELADVPEVRSSLLFVVGQVYLRIGEFQRSRELLERALAVMQDDPTTDPAWIHECRSELAETLTQLGEHELAIELLERLAIERAAEVSAAHWSVADLRMRQAWSLAALQRWDEADRMSSEALATLAADPATPSADLATDQMVRAGIVVERSRIEASASRESDLEEALALLRGASARLAAEPDQLRYAFQIGSAHNSTGLVLKYLGRSEEAGVEYERAIEVFRDVLGDDSKHVASCLVNISGLLMDSGSLEAAMPPLERALEVFSAVLPADSPDLVLVRGNHAGLLFRLGRCGEAITAYREVLPLQRRVFGDPHPIIVYSHLRLASCLDRAGDHAGAENNFLAAIEVGERLGDDFAAVHRTACQAAAAHYEARGRANDAAHWRERAAGR